MIDNFRAYLTKIAPVDEGLFQDSIGYFKPLSLKKDDYFIREGHVCRQVAFIDQGILRTFYLNDKAEMTTSCFCTLQSLTTSYKSLILQSPSTISIQAIEQSELLVIDYSNLQLLYSKSQYWQNIGRKIAEQEYLVMEQYASVLNNEGAKEKYARLLNEQPDVVLKANVAHIASYLGVTRRTLSRIRQEISG